MAQLEVTKSIGQDRCICPSCKKGIVYNVDEQIWDKYKDTWVITCPMCNHVFEPNAKMEKFVRIVFVPSFSILLLGVLSLLISPAWIFTWILLCILFFGGYFLGASVHKYFRRMESQHGRSVLEQNVNTTQTKDP